MIFEFQLSICEWKPAEFICKISTVKHRYKRLEIGLAW